MMMTENTTIRKPVRSSGTLNAPIYVSLSKNRSHHSEHAMNRNEPMQLPEMEPMPPMTTMSRISYVMADLNVLACTVVWYMASSAPEMPAKKDEIVNAMRL